MASLAVSLLFDPPAASAGTYVWTTTDANGNITAQSPAYSGGTFLNQGAKDPDIEDYAIYSDGTYGAGGGNTANYADDAPAEIACFGTITATFTWQPSYPGELPPSCAIVEQQCSAGAGCDGDGTGSYDDGLGDTGSVEEPGGNGFDGTLYTVKTSPGATFTVKCNPSADSGPAYADVWAEVSYSAAAFPVIVSLGGTTSDASNNQNILVGQGCTASLSGIPAALLNNTANPPTYQWSVSGSTFQSWSVSSDASHTTEIDGSGPLTNPTAHWYWDDVKGAKTVTCTATVTPPTGQGSSFSITATQNVNLAVPQTLESPTAGLVQINNHPPAVYGTNYALYLGGNSSQPWGIIFTTQVQTPALFASQSSGLWNMVQCVSPNFWTTVYQSWEVPDPANGSSGLDTRYPFYPGSGSSPSFPSGIAANNLIAQPYDAPGIGSLSNNIGRYRLQEGFKDYVMYLPPGSDTQWVPVWLIDWGWHADDTAPITNGQPDWSKASASSTDTAYLNSNAPTLLFPTWSSIIHG